MRPEIIRAMLKQVEETPSDQVNVPRGVFKATLYDLLRFEEAISQEERNKVEFIQDLTLEFAAAHFVDLVDTVRINSDDMDVDEVLDDINSQMKNFKETVKVF